MVSAIAAEAHFSLLELCAIRLDFKQAGIRKCHRCLRQLVGRFSLCVLWLWPAGVLAFAPTLSFVGLARIDGIILGQVTPGARLAFPLVGNAGLVQAPLSFGVLPPSAIQQHILPFWEIRMRADVVLGIPLLPISLTRR